MADALDTLTEKEKETLRLLLSGYDAKSMAAYLDLSVHTVNERLRNSRRKLSVSSSREAARMLAQAEASEPNSLVHKPLGDAQLAETTDQSRPSIGRHSGGQRKGVLPLLMIGGILLMSLFLALLMSGANVSETANDTTSQSPATMTVTQSDTAKENAAREWLALVDAANWQGSYDAAGRSFQAPNTVDGWREASELARVPLGGVLMREAIQFQAVNAPPNGFQIVRFRTNFEEREGVIESVTLERENDDWKVVGYFIQ